MLSSLSVIDAAAATSSTQCAACLAWPHLPCRCCPCSLCTAGLAWLAISAVERALCPPAAVKLHQNSRNQAKKASAPPCKAMVAQGNLLLQVCNQPGHSRSLQRNARLRGCTCPSLPLPPDLPGLTACNQATRRQCTFGCLGSRLRPLSAQGVVQHCHSYLFVSVGVLILSASTWAP